MCARRYSIEPWIGASRSSNERCQVTGVGCQELTIGEVKMNKITSYRDLLVWQRAMELVAECYRLTQRFPRNEEFGLKAQMRRAAVSIPSNIAEGHTRRHSKEFIQFLCVRIPCEVGDASRTGHKVQIYFTRAGKPALQFVQRGWEDASWTQECSRPLSQSLINLWSLIPDP
jgi:hypothetical protein